MSVKENRVCVRLDADTVEDMKSMSKEYNVSLSTMIRTLLIRSLNEVRIFNKLPPSTEQV